MLDQEKWIAEGFAWDERYREYAGTFVWNGTECRLHLEANASGNIEEKQMLVLAELQSNPTELDCLIRTQAAEQMIGLAEDWAEEENEIPTKESFAKRIQIEDIYVDSTGELSLYYGDDDMFAGHQILVFTDVHGNNLEASLAG